MTKAMTSEQKERLTFECGRVFTPSRPIEKRALFAGRTDELRKMFDAVNSPGKHVILYGYQGVGKTSLATILKELFAEYPTIRIGKINCERNDTFTSVWNNALSEISILIEGPDGNNQHTLNQWLDLGQYVGPGQIRQALQKGNAYIPELVIVFDEFDKLGREHRAMFADTIKDIADSLTNATVVLIGVANDVTELIADHSSIVRNLSQIKMPPMSRVEVEDILNKSLFKLDMSMTAEACASVVALAQGYPHYAHLLGKESAQSAISDRRREINTADVTTAIKEAVNDGGYCIADVYHKATLAQRKGTLFEQVLVACALAKVDEMGFFASTDVRIALNAITSKNYEIYGFSQHLERFSSEQERGPVFEKRGSKRSYRYRFINPLLRPYAIIKGMVEGLVTIDMLQRFDNPKEKKTIRVPRIIPTPKKTTDKSLFDEL